MLRIRFILSFHAPVAMGAQVKKTVTAGEGIFCADGHLIKPFAFPSQLKIPANTKIQIQKILDSDRQGE